MSNLNENDGKNDINPRLKHLFFSFDNDNQFCADCNKNEFEYLSINNGVCICKDCAEQHKKLGHQCSFVRKYDDKWDDYLLKYIQKGGNTRFKAFTKEYNLDSLSIQDKYLTRGLIYYREVLKSEVMNYESPGEIPLDSAQEIVSEVSNNYPEFENYNYVKKIDLETLEEKYGKKGEIKENKEVNPTPSVIHSISGFFSSFTKSLNSAAEQIKEQIKEKVSGLNLQEKILEGSAMAVETVKGVLRGEEAEMQEEAVRNNIEGAVGGIEFDEMFKKDEAENEKFKELEEKLFKNGGV